jgi:hypothetical protein
VHLGFKTKTLENLVEKAGFQITCSETINSGDKDSFQVILLCGAKT